MSDLSVIARIKELLAKHQSAAEATALLAPEGSVGAAAAPVNMAAVVAILNVVLQFEPTLLTVLNTLIPNNPIIEMVVSLGPTILPFLTQLEAALTAVPTT